MQYIYLLYQYMMAYILSIGNAENNSSQLKFL